ncbi:hypothetical protein [Nocardia fluminea]|uniref:hypothetical protein n=1 Tax=Nocardia fluminea TaxID=134984 RepID=UPI001FE338F4|nr:hypothetical protein [Nocardia fluminea]
MARSAFYELLALPLAFTRVRTRLRVPRLLLREPVGAHNTSLGRCLIQSVLSGGVGLVGWFLAMLSVLVLVRGLAYPLVAADGYETSWGGPTLAGAWLVHAALGAVIAPVLIAMIALFGQLQLRVTRTVLGGDRSWWAIPAAVILAAAGALFFVAWVRQI